MQELKNNLQSKHDNDYVDNQSQVSDLNRKNRRLQDENDQLLQKINELNGNLESEKRKVIIV